MKLVDALVGALRDWGVGYVFGVSGANIEHVHDAIHRVGDGELRSVFAKSEVGAAFMADARARTHRTLGVCCATSGGGMMNLAVGIAESFAESVPVLAIVGQIPRTLEGRGGFQDSSGIGRTVDALAMWRSMTKYAARLDSAEGFWEKLAEAAREAMGGRQGPSVLLPTRDAYELDVGPRPPWFPRTLAELAAPMVPSHEDVRALFDALQRARRPVILAGSGVDRAGAAASVARFAIDAGIPVMTTMANPASFPNDHALYLGVVGAAGHPSAHAYLNDEADLVVVVGTGLPSMVRQPIARALERAAIAVVNVEDDASRVAPAALSIAGDARLVFEALRALHAARPFRHPPVAYELTRYLPELVARPDSAVRAIGEPRGGLLQSQAIDVLQSYLPAQGHVFFDAGNCAAAAIHGLALPPHATSTIALGMGGMGYAIAGAIGAQLGARGRARSMVLCGDGAFLMLGFEVHTAIEENLPILFVVFNNAKHGMCVTRQQVYFDGRIECSEYARVNLATTARGFGDAARLWVGRASNTTELRRALEEYDASAPRPGVLELVLLREEVPPFGPFLAPDHPTYAVRHESTRGWVLPAA